MIKEAYREITNLKVEYQKNPIGIDVENPRFSWNMSSSERGQKQYAYQLLVASNRNLLNKDQADIWNSGIVQSSQSVAITYEGPHLSPSTKYVWKVIVWDKHQMPVHSPIQFFETGLMSTDGHQGWSGAKWITMTNKKPNSPGAPIFRRVANLSGKLLAARLYISSLGVFQAYVNGKRVTTKNEYGMTSLEMMTPGWTNYDRTINYMTYDVTDFIEDKEQVTIGAILGNGWYNGRISKGSIYYSENGNPLALFAKLLLTYEDGTTQFIVTNTESEWRATDTGPFLENDIYDGETYDATKELTGWGNPNYDDSKWETVEEHPYQTLFPNVKVIAYPGETARFIDNLDQTPKKVVKYREIVGRERNKNGKGKIHAFFDSTLEDLNPSDKTISLNSLETMIYDLGQNMVGVPEILLKGNAGTQIQLRFGEILNDDSEGADGPMGSVYFANLRTAKQTVLYTLKGTEEGETYQPSMSFFGFRYVEVSILTPNAFIEVLRLTGKVATSLTKQYGKIETSNEDVNQLFNNIIWGNRGNYLWIPTDCPQRDERLGWTGDTQLFANTALYNGNANLFLENFMDTLVDSQEIYGFNQASFTSTAPGHQYANFNSFSFEGKGPKGQSGWADIGIILPWTVWQMTGDLTIVKKNYGAMVKYMNWLYSITGDSYKGPGGIGDWLGFQGTGNQLISDVYYAYDARLMTEMAQTLENQDDVKKYQTLFNNIKNNFIKRFLSFDEKGDLTVKSSLIEDQEDLFEDGIFAYKSVKEDNTQTALLWCLKLGLYENKIQKKQLIKLLIDNLSNNEAYKTKHPTSTRLKYAENTLSIGFLGVNIIAPVLSDNGLSKLSYALLLQDKMPSWLYSVKNGATTIWERWNSYSIEDGFGNEGMNSFNHYSYGAIAEWMFKYMAGISVDRQHPGFKYILLKPTIDPNKRITSVSASYDSVYGTISSSWAIDKENFIYQVTIPANTTARLTIPARSKTEVLEDHHPIRDSKGIASVEYIDKTITLEVESGTYNFISKI